MKYDHERLTKGLQGKLQDEMLEKIDALSNSLVVDTTGNESTFTHKSGAPKFGKFYVQQDLQKDLISKFVDVIQHGGLYQLEENVPQNAPIMIRFNLKSAAISEDEIIELKNMVDEGIMFALVNNIVDVMKHTMDMNNISDDELSGLILLSDPYIAKRVSQTGEAQDSIHQEFEIRFPKCIVNHKILVSCIITSLRRHISRNVNPFSNYGVNMDIEDIIQDVPETVPYYGSVISNRRPLKLYKAWKYSNGRIIPTNSDEIVESIAPEYPDGTKIPIPSYDDEQSCLEYLVYSLSQMRMGRKSNLHIYKATTAVDTSAKTEQQILSLLQHTYEVTKLLDLKRARSRINWLEVGQMIHSINLASLEALNIWIDFSKRAGDAYVPGACEKAWIDFTGKKYEFQTLCDLAEEDSPVEFADWKRNYYRDMYAEVYASSAPATEWAVAKLVTAYRGGKTVYANDKWYNFENGKWQKYQKDEFLTLYVMNVILEEFKIILKFLNTSGIDNAFIVDDIIMDEGIDDPEDAMYLDGEIDQGDEGLPEAEIRYAPYKARAETFTSYKTRCKKNLIDVIKYISKGTFVSKVCHFCKATMLDNRFEDKLDCNRMLIGMENGVYDLETGTLRKAVPSDYISRSCGIKYIDYTENCIEVKEVHKYYSQVFPNSNIREYVLNLFSTFLEAGNAMKIFQVWSGCGNNGKSILQLFFEYTLGEYVAKAPTQLITSKRINPSAPSPELIALNKVRLATCEEPSSSEKIVCGVMKQLTGNDTLPVRGLYGRQIMMKPTFSLVLHCNDLPDFDSQDEATWNRVRLIPFESVFNDKAPSNEAEQLEKKHFKARHNITGYLKNIASANFWLLSQIYKSARYYNFRTPEEIMQATRQYRKDTDIYALFSTSALRKVQGTEANRINPSELYQYFKIWYQRTISEERAPKRREFLTAFRRTWGDCNQQTGCFHNIEYVAVQDQH